MSRKLILIFALLGFFVQGCAEVNTPDARNVNIPSPVTADQRKQAVNERPDSVMYLPLGEDVLVPERTSGEKLPSDVVGPFELRSETLSAALQLILANYDVAIALETNAGLERQVTVTNLKGPLHQVVNRVCSLADLYCSYEEGAIIVKDTQTFTVTLPPLAGADGGDEFITDVIRGLAAVVGVSDNPPVADPTTRSLIYSATQRTSTLAANYFQRLRASTAMIVFETYIWEVALDSGNSTGVDWSSFDTLGKFNTSIGVNGSVAAGFTNPISIGLPTTSAIGATPTQLVQFLSSFGAVKTISQPQITVLSGSEAELRVADTENYVSEVTSTVSGDQTTTSVNTDSVDSGFTLSIDSSWDKATVYANVAINLTNVVSIDDFTFSDSGADGTDTIIQLPQTTERELTTQIRVRPGDSVLIGGLVRETDNLDTRGLGFMKPIIPDSRTAQTSNLELVILLRPRVVVYTDGHNQKYKDYIEQKTLELRSSKARSEWMRTQEEAVPYLRRSELTSPVINKPIAPIKVFSEESIEPVQDIISGSSVSIEVQPQAKFVDVDPPVVDVTLPTVPVNIKPVVVSDPVIPSEVDLLKPQLSDDEVEPLAVKLTSPESYVPKSSSGYETGYVSQYKVPVTVPKETNDIEDIVKATISVPEASKALSIEAPNLIENQIASPVLEEDGDYFEAGQGLFGQ